MDDSSTVKSDQDAMDDDALLEQGSRALQQLTAQAEMARAEARRAELEWILQQARKGQTGHLRQWLQVNQRIVAVDQGIPFSMRQEVVEQSDMPPSQHSDHSTLWQQPPTAEVTVALQPVSALQRSDTTIKRSASKPTEKTLERPVDAGKATQSPKVIHSDKVSQTDKVGQPIRRESGARSSPRLAIPTLEVVAPNKRTRRLGGIVVSILAHVLLVLALGFITIKLPVDGSIFALEASSEAESTTQDFEMSSPVDVDQPTELLEPTQSMQESNLAESLSDFGEPVSEGRGQATAVSSASQLSNRSAVTAVRSQPSKSVVTFYGAAATGNSFCFVIDGSGSMRGGPWEAARNELLRCIGALKPTQRFHVIFFNKEISVIPDPEGGQPATAALYATPENKMHAQRWLESLQIAIGAPPIDALKLALELECDGIYFLADGEMSDKAAKRLLEILREKNRTDDIVDGQIVLVPIHTIAYYSDKGLAVMKAIADENRGQFAYVPKPGK